jgi:hypothetical protein
MVVLGGGGAVSYERGTPVGVVFDDSLTPPQNTGPEARLDYFLFVHPAEVAAPAGNSPIYKVCSRARAHACPRIEFEVNEFKSDRIQILMNSIEGRRVAGWLFARGRRPSWAAVTCGGHEERSRGAVTRSGHAGRPRGLKR